MRVEFNPDAYDWHEHFTQHGGAITPFQGFPYQRGAGLGSIFRSLLRAVMPIAKTAGKAIGKQALRSGMGFAADVLEGANPKDAAMKHVKTGSANLMRQGEKSLNGKKRGMRDQDGGGLGKAMKTINTTGQIVKSKSKTKPQRKKLQKKKDILGVYLA